jgi:hypothetical protein
LEGASSGHDHTSGQGADPGTLQLPRGREELGLPDDSDPRCDSRLPER